MDLADASLVAAAEQHDLRRIFTFDRHFHAYRWLQSVRPNYIGLKRMTLDVRMA